jgi:NADPH:quinone reductase-like Zn-dependent oxidoreductase
MKAAIYKTYGPPEVLKIEDVQQPYIHDEDANIVLIKVHSSSVNPFDVLHRKGYLPVRLSGGGLLKPKRNIQILGIDVAGTVAAGEKNVHRFKN